jgi:adenylate cyclase
VADFNFFENSDDPMQDIEIGSMAAGLQGLTLGAMPAAPGKPEQLPVFWPEEFRQASPSLFSHPRWGYTNSYPDSDSVIRRYRWHGSLAQVGANSSETPPATSQLLRWHGTLEQLRARGVPVLTAGVFAIDGLEVFKHVLGASPDLDPAAMVQAAETMPPPTDALVQQAFALVRGRTVFVGANAAGAYDYVATPCGSPEPGVLVHWNAFASATAGGFLRPAGPLVSGAAMVLIVGILGWISRRGIRIGLPAMVAGGGAFLALGGSAGAFVGGWWFAPMLPVAGAATGFAAAAVQSFLLERERKRQIQGWFGSYVSPSVVRQLIHNPDSLRLGGERRELTVFFSDLAGFTTLSEKLPPDTLVALMNLYLEEMTECVFRERCYLDKYIGDAVMAVFGSPEKLDNHALAACRAALACQRRLDELNTAIEKDHGLRLGMRIGINTGPMIVGNVGSTKKRNYTVLGDAVNLGARLEGANKEFGTGILIGPGTAAALAGALVLRPVARLKVKGKHQAVEVFELIGEPDTVGAELRRFLDAYSQGYTAYCERRFEEAQHAFAAAAALRPEDFLAKQYAHEAHQLTLSPPGADWEPILELHSK